MLKYKSEASVTSKTPLTDTETLHEHADAQSWLSSMHHLETGTLHNMLKYTSGAFVTSKIPLIDTETLKEHADIYSQVTCNYQHFIQRGDDMLQNMLQYTVWPPVVINTLFTDTETLHNMLKYLADHL